MALIDGQAALWCVSKIKPWLIGSLADFEWDYVHSLHWPTKRERELENQIKSTAHKLRKMPKNERHTRQRQQLQSDGNNSSTGQLQCRHLIALQGWNNSNNNNKAPSYKHKRMCSCIFLYFVCILCAGECKKEFKNGPTGSLLLSQ